MMGMELRVVQRDEYGDACVVTSCQTLGLDGGAPPRGFL